MRISDWSSDVVLCRSQSGTPSPRPQRRLERASHMLEAGRPAAALAEVTRMPGRAAGSKWMEKARRYIEARRALDLIETAAILEPRRLRAIAGATVDGTQPLARSEERREGTKWVGRGRRRGGEE